MCNALFFLNSKYVILFNIIHAGRYQGSFCYKNLRRTRDIIREILDNDRYTKLYYFDSGTNKKKP